MYSIFNYAFDDLGVDVPKSEFTKERELDLSDDVIFKIDGSRLVNDMLNSVDDNDKKEIITDRNYNQKDFLEIAKERNCTKQSVWKKYNKEIKRLE